MKMKTAWIPMCSLFSLWGHLDMQQQVISHFAACSETVLKLGNLSL